MTDDRMALIDLIQKSSDGDFLRSIAEFTLQRLMAFEVEGVCGAGRHERNEGRTNYRNGYRPRQLETRLGTLDLRIPKLRQGSYFPPGILLPGLSRAAQDGGEGADGGDPGSLDPGSIDPQGR